MSDVERLKAAEEARLDRIKQASGQVPPDHPRAMTCNRCGKRLSRKTARQIGREIMCSACLFAPAGTRPQGGDGETGSMRSTSDAVDAKRTGAQTCHSLDNSPFIEHRGGMAALPDFGITIPEGYVVIPMGSTEATSHWHRPRCPSKRRGRIGTRKAWKREHPPGVWMFVTTYDGGGNVRDQFWTA